MEQGSIARFFRVERGDAARDRRPSRPRAVIAVTIAVAVCAGAGAVALARSSGASHVELTAATTGATTGAAPGAKATVTGTGTTSGTPDELTIQMGASTSASTASSALDRNDREIAALDAVFTHAGVEPAQILTSGLSLQPTYDSSGNISGYQASDELTVTLRDLAKAGAVIDAGAHAVGNDAQIDEIEFSIADTSSLLERARTRAVQAAQAEAEAFAQGAGTTLGPVLSIGDEEQQPVPLVQPSNFAAKVASGASTPVPVQAGSEQIEVQVHVVYSLKSGRS